MKMRPPQRSNHVNLYGYDYGHIVFSPESLRKTLVNVRLIV